MTKKNQLILIMLVSCSALLLGVLGTSFAFDNTSVDALYSQNNDLPMRIDLSYENKQLTNNAHSVGNYSYVDVKTYRNNAVRLLQSFVSYLDSDKKIKLTEDGWFGNIGGDSGISRDPINGLTRIHFENGTNLKVKYGWSGTSGSTREEIPDSNGDVFFSGLKPSYFRVEQYASGDVTFSSCEIYYDCVGASAPASNPTVLNSTLNQSFYGADVGELYIVDSPDSSLAAHLSNGNYIFAKRNQSLANALDLHNLVMSFDLDKSVGGQTHYEGVRLDDQFVSNLSIEFVNSEQSQTKEGVQSMRLSFTYKGIVDVSNQFTLFGYYRSESHYNVISIDNVRQQNDETLPEDNEVLINSYVEIIGFGAQDAFDQTSAQRQVGRAFFKRIMTLKELRDNYDLSLGQNPFTALGSHELSFKLDSRYRTFGTYLVFNESNYIKSVEYHGFKEEIKAGFDLVTYFNSGNTYVSFKYQDGTSRDVTITSSEVDLSLVDINVEGLYPYYVDIDGYGKVKQLVSVVLSGIEDETGAIIYETSDENKENVYAYGLDEYCAFNKLYIKSIVAKDGQYRATCYTDLDKPDKTLERFGSYVIDSFEYNSSNIDEIVLFGQLWSSRIQIDSSQNTLITHSEIETNHPYSDIVYIPDEDNSYMFTDSNPFHFYSSNNNELMIEYGGMRFRTTCFYLNEEKTRISFRFPFFTVTLNFEATLDNVNHTICVEEPSYLYN